MLIGQEPGRHQPRLADAGYVVLSYTPRGFYLSGGYIETAGPKDISDVSDVIDWLLLPADPDAVMAAAMRSAISAVAPCLLA